MFTETPRSNEAVLHPPAPSARAEALILALLAVVFLGRVVGQAIVALSAPRWLPPMEEWYSGLIPYPVLLPIQILILALQARISWDLWHGAGLFARRSPRLGVILIWFALIYFMVMLSRYVITMALFPERRWFGHAIPIFFHWVLAGYLFAWSRYHRGRA